MEDQQTNNLELSPAIKRVTRRPRQISNYQSAQDSVMTKLKDRLSLMKSQIIDKQIPQSKRDEGFSKNVRLTSNDNDLNPQQLLRQIRLNKITHMKYNPTLMNNEWRKHFKEVIHKTNVTQTQDQQIDFDRDFGATWRYAAQRSGSNESHTGRTINQENENVITDPCLIQTSQDMHSYKRGLRTSRIFNRFHFTVQNQETTGEKEKKMPVSIVKDTQDFINSQYDRNMTRKIGARTMIRPNYLKPFSYEKPIDVSEKLEAIKGGEYSLEKEEIQLLDIIKDLQSNPKDAYKKIKNVGILNFKHEQKKSLPLLEPVNFTKNEEQEQFNHTAEIDSYYINDMFSQESTNIDTSNIIQSHQVKQQRFEKYRSYIDSTIPQKTRNNQHNVTYITEIDPDIKMLRRFRQRSQDGTNNQSSRNLQSTHIKSKSMNKRFNPLDNKMFRDLWTNVTQNAKTSNTTRIELDKEISSLRKETDNIQYKLDIVKACNAQIIEQKFDNMLEQSKFQNELFEDMFCSRNVIQQIKSDNDKKVLFLRTALGVVQNHSKRSKK